MILFVAWLGWVFDIMDTALFNFVKTPMLTQIMGNDFPKAQLPELEGRIQMLFLLGWAIGGVVFGILADRWSRTKTMALTILLYALFTGLTAFCQSWEQVAAIRFLTALGIGGEWAAGAALVAEAFSDKFRPTAASILQTAASVGPWLAALLNWAIIRPFAADQVVNLGPVGLFPWQWMFIVGVIPAIAAFLVRFLVSEPPVQKEKSPNTLKDIWENRQHRKVAFLIMLIGTVGIAGAGNATFWLPNLVKAASEGMTDTMVAERNTQATLIQHVGTLVGVFFFPWLAKTRGRKIALGTGFGLAFLFAFFALRMNPSYEMLLWIFPSIAFAAIGVTSVFGLYFPELFPSRVRATGAGLGYNVARAITIPVPWITGMLMGAQSKQPSGGVALAGVFYLLGLIVLIYLPETKDQPLPE